MKKQLICILGIALSIHSIGQEQAPKLIPCNTFAAMEEGFKANPGLKEKYEQIQAQMESEYQKLLVEEAGRSNFKTAATQSVIPVVFHIMGPQTISDQVFINLISYINNDYGRTGSDVATINPSFSSLYVDSDIRFALAKRDPDGNCTNGIIRHNSDNIYWSQTSPAYNYSGTGTGRWPTNRYLNIYIVECISGPSNPCPPTGSYIGGYTYLPGGTPYTSNGNKGDAIVVLKNQLAQSDPLDSRTLSHEIGHWLNLSHTFGNSNSPVFGNSSPPSVSCGSATLNDGVADTPETKGYFSICPSTFSGDCTSLPNIENIMDYSSCPKMFTQGQITKMRAALGSSTGGRNNLWSTSNMVATGIAASFSCAPIANFVANKFAVCTGNTITFTNQSAVGTSGTLAWSFEAGSPATSTATAPVVSYATPGTYSVMLTATNASGNNTKTEIAYITVTQGGGGVTLPNVHNFDSGNLPGISVINKEAGSVAWALNTSNGANSTTQSIYLNSASQTSTGGNIDIFETPVYNFANTNGITLSYYYAYAKKTASQVDSFKVQYSFDCGGTWTNVLGIPSLSTMASNSGGTLSSAFVPTAAQWKQTNIASALLTSLSNKPSVKFRFYFKSDATVGSSNNIYIDQINLSGAVGLNELENSLGLSIYPNPTNASAVVDFNLISNEKIKIHVMDVVGRIVEESSDISVNGNRGSYTVNKNGNLARGIYIVNIEVNNQRISKKLIVE